MGVSSPQWQCVSFTNVIYSLFFLYAHATETFCLSPLAGCLFRQRSTSFIARQDFHFPVHLCHLLLCSRLLAFSIWLKMRGKKKLLVLPSLHRTVYVLQQILQR